MSNTTQLIKLNSVTLAIQTHKGTPKAPPVPIHHLIAIDISGSMGAELPELRLHLKNKLPSLVGVNDTVSLIWFSGRGQCGTLVEALKINGLADLSNLHAAIDRFLVPTGLTGFKEPLAQAGAIVDRLKAKTNASLFNLFFMTDGHDNQWAESDILDLCRQLEPKIDSAAIIEYGWCCNRKLLTQMAATLGGNLVFSSDFQSYTVAFEGALQGKTKKVSVKLTHKPTGDFVFALSGGHVLTFTPDAHGIVLVPEDITKIAYEVADLAGDSFDPHKHTDPLLFAVLVPLAQRLQSDKVFAVLSALGDIALVQSFTNCFSKEDYIRFQTEALAAAEDITKRYLAGYDAHAVPKADAYTVLHLLSDLASSAENLFYPYHSAFHYERIGAVREAAAHAATFTAANKEQGYPINGLVWNEDRPNVSIRVEVPGLVHIPNSRPANIPETIESHIYRTYTIIRDGIVHTRTLPISLTQATFDKLQSNGLLQGETWASGKIFVLTYPKLPVINRMMVSNVSAKNTFDSVVQLALLKGSQKVFNDWRARFMEDNKLKPLFKAKSQQFEVLYGTAGAEYLKSVGLTESNGFNPAGHTVKSGDFYIAHELKIAIKGLSALPKVLDVETAIDSGRKLKLNEFVMSDAIKRIDAFMATPSYTSAADGVVALVEWVDAEQNSITAQTRKLMETLAQQKFAIVVGHSWFSDMPTVNDNSLSVDLPGFGAVQVTATLKEVQISL